MAAPIHDPIGSIWRVWDLHFHTPASYDYLDMSVKNEDIVHTLVSAGVSVVAITDHHVIDAQRIVDLQVLGQDQLVVLPGIEVRTELGGRDSVHVVAVFPEDCEIGSIWDKLRVKHKLVQQVEDRGHEGVYVDFRDFADDVHDLNGLTIVHAGTKTNSIEEIANSTAFKMVLKTDLARESSDIFEIANPKNIPAYTDKVFPAIGKDLPLILLTVS
jgi:exonuclease SbcC